MEDANTCGGEEGNQISKRGRRSFLSDTQKTKEEDEPFWKEREERNQGRRSLRGGCWVHGRTRKARKKTFFKTEEEENVFFLNILTFIF